MALTHSTLNHNDVRRLTRRVHVCALPTDVTRNASEEITLDGDGNPTQIDVTVDGATFRRTISGWGTSTLTVSAWSEV